MEWKYYFGYKISNTGLVTKKNSNELQPLKIHKRGYLLAHIQTGGIDTKKWVLVHRLVANLFIPNPDQKPQVNHIDGDKTNNSVDNLEWVTNSENRQHAVKTGLIAKGEKLSKKLSVEQVREIKSSYVKGSSEFGSYALAKKYGVSQSLILKIIKGVEWKSVNA